MKRRRRSLLLSFLLASTITTNAQTTIQPRYGQATVYANNTAYFLGGILSDTSLSTDFFSLDLSTQFNISSPPWHSLPSLLTSTANAAAAIDPEGRIYLLGGQTWDCTSTFANVYDPQTSGWGTPQFFGTAPIRRQAARTFLSNDNQVIYYFGGVSTSCATGTATVYNTLNALSIQNSSWFSPANSHPPVAESGFAVTKVMPGQGTTEQILIIGGQAAANNTFVQMSQLGLFDMTSQSWTFVTATTASGEDPPEERVGHTAVTTSDGKVIVYGGTVGPTERAAVPQLTVLDTSSLPFQWSSPNISGNASFGPSAGLTGHSAIMTDGNTLILAFGKDENNNFNPTTFFLDTQKWEWQDIYTPTTASSTSPSSPDSPTTTTNKPNNSNPHSTTTGDANTTSDPSSDSADADTSSKKTTIAVSTSVPITIVALASAAALIIFLRRRHKRRHQSHNQNNNNRLSRQRLLSQSYELSHFPATSNKYLPPRTPRRGHPSTRVFKRIFSRGKAHASPPPNPHPPMGVFLPAWAQEHVGSRRNPFEDDDDDDEGVEGRMVQVASMSFMAPKMQLRVVNPDTDSIDEARRRVSAGKQV
jgi:hypothetical protein